MLAALLPACLTSPSLLNPHSPSPFYFAILKNPLKVLKGPNEGKAFIEKVCPNPNDIAELRRSNDERKLVVWSKKTASQIIENVKRAEPSLIVSLKEPASVVSIKRVPEDLNELSLKQIIPKGTKTVQCGKSGTFEVYLPSRTDLDTFLKASMKVG
jgi:hypothetical protein